MKNKRLVFIVSVVSFIMLTVVALAILNVPKTDGSVEEARDGDIVEFEGVLTEFKNDCSFDGVCSATINNKYEIILNIGNVRPQPIYGAWDIGEDDIGKDVRIRAIKAKDNLSIIGSEEYFVLKK